MMDEASAIMRARRFSKFMKEDELPVSLEAYLKEITKDTAELRFKYDESLGEDEAGQTVPVNGKQCIILNANDPPARQRFSACHEVAHIMLALPTEHTGKRAAFASRLPNEVLCDVFAAELLLPAHLIRPRVHAADIDFSAVETLAKTFEGSLTATGSRFAQICDRPCAFVLAENGIVRYSSRSASLKALGGWIRPGLKLPAGSAAARLAGTKGTSEQREIDAGEWLDGWERAGMLLEDARYSVAREQTLSLLWFENDKVSGGDPAGDDDDEELALRPLDGVLPWPGKSRRRR